MIRLRLAWARLFVASTCAAAIGLATWGCQAVRMIEFRREVDTNVSGPVTLVNELVVDDGEEKRFLATWGRVAEYMRAQPGFVSTRLHRGVGGSSRWLNYAVWASAADFRRAIDKPEFRALAAAIPARASPHLYQSVAEL